MEDNNLATEIELLKQENRFRDKEMEEIKSSIKDLAKSVSKMSQSMTDYVNQLKEVQEITNDYKNNNNVSLLSLMKTAIVGILTGGIGMALTYGFIHYLK